MTAWTGGENRSVRSVGYGDVSGAGHHPAPFVQVGLFIARAHIDIAAYIFPASSLAKDGNRLYHDNQSNQNSQSNYCADSRQIPSANPREEHQVLPLWLRVTGYGLRVISQRRLFMCLWVSRNDMSYCYQPSREESRRFQKISQLLRDLLIPSLLRRCPPRAATLQTRPLPPRGSPQQRYRSDANRSVRSASVPAISCRKTGENHSTWSHPPE